MHTSSVLLVLGFISIACIYAAPKLDASAKREKRNCVCPSQQQPSCYCPNTAAQNCPCAQQSSCECQEKQPIITYNEPMTTVYTTTVPEVVTYPINYPSTRISRCCYHYTGTIKLCFSGGVCSQQAVGNSQYIQPAPAPQVVYTRPAEVYQPVQSYEPAPQPLQQEYQPAQPVNQPVQTYQPVYQSSVQYQPAREIIQQEYQPSYQLVNQTAQSYQTEPQLPFISPCSKSGNECQCSTGYIPCSNGKRCCRR